MPSNEDYHAAWETYVRKTQYIPSKEGTMTREDAINRILEVVRHFEGEKNIRDIVSECLRAHSNTVLARYRHLRDYAELNAWKEVHKELGHGL